MLSGKVADKEDGGKGSRVKWSSPSPGSNNRCESCWWEDVINGSSIDNQENKHGCNKLGQNHTNIEPLSNGYLQLVSCQLTFIGVGG